ncbi:MAG: hypothetical protein HY553_20375, partial [Elusimicrobia bacterium]|nr:hypothetical protein [Elusimicrobiota bacterium]
MPRPHRQPRPHRPHRPERPRRRGPAPAPPPSGPMVRGVLEHHGRFAFILMNVPGKQDLMVRGPTLRLAMNGDTVEARIQRGREGRSLGEITRVLERAKRTVVGILGKRGPAWTATPEEEEDALPIEVLGFEKGLGPQPGAVVVVRVTRWPTMSSAAAGVVQEVLG